MWFEVGVYLVKLRLAGRLYAGLSALFGKGMVTWGLSPQAGIARTLGASAPRASDLILNSARNLNPRFLADSSLGFEPAGHRPSTIPAWGDNPRFRKFHTR